MEREHEDHSITRGWSALECSSLEADDAGWCLGVELSAAEAKNRKQSKQPDVPSASSDRLRIDAMKCELQAKINTIVNAPRKSPVPSIARDEFQGQIDAILKFLESAPRDSTDGELQATINSAVDARRQ